MKRKEGKSIFQKQGPGFSDVWALSTVRSHYNRRVLSICLRATAVVRHGVIRGASRGPPQSYYYFLFLFFFLRPSFSSPPIEALIKRSGEILRDLGSYPHHFFFFVCIIYILFYLSILLRSLYSSFYLTYIMLRS